MRQRDIVRLLQETRQVDVAQLVQRFGVTGMTIRRDLAELEDAGQLHRVHGGATIRRAPAYNSRASVQAPSNPATPSASTAAPPATPSPPNCPTATT
jgi:DeoR/GlpR family transcriptional regulator of sugar metabolism